MSVRYLRDGVDVTTSVTGKGLVVSGVRPGNYVTLTIEMRAINAPRKAQRTAVLTVRNSEHPTQLDVVKAILVR